jgi:ELWxxDGT repeat protein
MEKVTACLLLLVIAMLSLQCQEPEMISNTLLVSNAYLHNTVLDSIYYFTAHDGDYDYELWRSNGTPEGTSLVANINPGGPSMPGNITAVGHKLFFTADNSDAPKNLYVSDGSTEGTKWVANIDPENLVLYHYFTASGGLLYFRDNTPDYFMELWVSDGTSEHTLIVADISEFGSSFPHELTDLKESLFFVANDNKFYNDAIFASKGIASDYTVVGGVNARALMATADHLFYSSTYEDFGDEPSTSAYTGGVSMLSDINPGKGGSNAYHFTEVGNRIFFRAYEPGNGAELWAYTPSEASTKLVMDINPGEYNSSFPDQLINFKDKLYFCANDGTHGKELWISDGTLDSTYMLKNIAENDVDYIRHSSPGKFFVTKELLFFVADDNIHGPELWQTDGTPEGTKMTADIWPQGNEGSDPGGFGIAGGYLLFNAWYGKRTLFRHKLESGPNTHALKEVPMNSIDLSLYPNPARSILVIESNSEKGFLYQVLDISGRKLISGNGSSRLTRLDVSGLESGLYLLYANAGSVSICRKFIID